MNRRNMNEQISSELNELFSALSKAQSEFLCAGKDKSNPFYKSTYADLASIVNASRPALSKNGLAVTQCIETEDGKSYLVTILGHSSGQAISSKMLLIPVDQKPQSMGSCITYFRRYAYAALVGVVVDEEDDDGNAASGKVVLIHIDDAKYIEENLKNHPEKNKEWLQKLGIKQWSQLPADKVPSILNRIEKLIT